MRRLQLVALAAVLLASCTQSSGGAFSDPTQKASPQPVAKLDLDALGRLRDQLAAAAAAHTSRGNLELGWGAGPDYPSAGPYRNTAAVANALDLLAARSLATTAVRPDTLQPAIPALSAATAAGYRDLAGPDGAAYLLLARLGPAGAGCASPSPTPSPESTDPGCLRAGFADAIMTGWYAPDSKSFFHVGDPTTIYRPVDAFAVGAAMVVAGYQGEGDDKKIGAGSDIIAKEMGAGFDPHFGLVYGLMSATPRGSRQATDTNTRLADQAGIAEMLLQAFDASREQQYLADAAKVLEPLLDEHAGLRADAGYLAGFDLKTTGPGPDTPVDFEATLLVLQAARHYDRDDGGHFSPLEEAAAQALLNGAGKVDASQGLPAALQAAVATRRSGIVTALGIVAITDVLAHPPGASPPAPSPPAPPSP